MNLPRLLTDFQVRFVAKSAELTHLLGIEYENWNHFKQLVINIAENPNILPECLYILMNHEFKPRIWDAESFVLFLNYIDKELTKIFFCIISEVINHPIFGPYCVHHRQNCVIQLGYARDYSGKLEYNGFEFYDALVEINNYFVRFIPVYRPMPFFESRLPLCDIDVAQLRESSLAQRQKMLVISGLSRLLVSRLFYFKKNRKSKQMKTMMLKNF